MKEAIKTLWSYRVTIGQIWLFLTILLTGCFYDANFAIKELLFCCLYSIMSIFVFIFIFASLKK